MVSHHRTQVSFRQISVLPSHHPHEPRLVNNNYLIDLNTCLRTFLLHTFRNFQCAKFIKGLGLISFAIITSIHVGDDLSISIYIFTTRLLSFITTSLIKVCKIKWHKKSFKKYSLRKQENQFKTLPQFQYTVQIQICYCVNYTKFSYHHQKKEKEKKRLGRAKSNAGVLLLSTFTWYKSINLMYVNVI